MLHDKDKCVCSVCGRSEKKFKGQDAAQNRRLLYDDKCSLIIVLSFDETVTSDSNWLESLPQGGISTAVAGTG